VEREGDDRRNLALLRKLAIRLPVPRARAAGNPPAVTARA
jgi:hypothetical protein